MSISIRFDWIKSMRAKQVCIYATRYISDVVFGKQSSEQDTHIFIVTPAIGDRVMQFFITAIAKEHLQEGHRASDGAADTGTCW